MTGEANLAHSFAAKKFDYLVIGGGTAGLVVAARLSERQDLNIGVLEAGHRIPDDLPAVSVPGRFGEGIGTDIDWKFETVAQKALDGRKLAWPRGKCLGGTSALNFMTWNRPSRNDIDSWEQLGCQGWSWDRLLPYYKRSENFVPPTAESAEQNTIHYDGNAHGTGGPVTVSFNKEYSATHKFWHKTLEALGIPVNQSHTSGSNVGSFTAMVAVNPERATREFSAPAYLEPAEKRSNLTVLSGAHVQHVMIEDGSLAAKGVQFEYDGLVYSAFASKEVIISAGSVQSPQILERSGIGSPSILQDAGIQVKVPNSNVGENLQDHLMHATIYEVDSSLQSPDDLRTDVELAAQADEEYKTSASGMRTWLGCSFAYIPLHTFLPPSEFSPLLSRLSSTSSAPRPQAHASHLHPDSPDGHMEFIFDVGNWNPNFVGAPGKKYATLLQILQYPFSRGSIHIDPSAPLGPPVIDPKYYEGEEGSIDLDIAFHAAKLGHKIVSTDPLKSLVKKRVFPPEEIRDEDLKAWLVSYLTTDWHPVGTCAMGEKEGVVDERLRVHGVKGLRVVDASIMPLQISAHLQATVYAIGEKGADMILEDM